MCVCRRVRADFERPKHGHSDDLMNRLGIFCVLLVLLCHCNCSDGLSVLEAPLALVHIPKTGGTLFASQLLHLQTPVLPCTCDTHNDFIKSAYNGGISRRTGAHHRDGSCLCPLQAVSPTTSSNSNQWQMQWNLSPPTMGFRCGVHATLERMKLCLSSSQREIQYITMLRDPLERLLSEFDQVRVWGVKGRN